MTCLKKVAVAAAQGGPQGTAGSWKPGDPGVRSQVDSAFATWLVTEWGRPEGEQDKNRVVFWALLRAAF